MCLYESDNRPELISRGRFHIFVETDCRDLYNLLFILEWLLKLHFNYIIKLIFYIRLNIFYLTCYIIRILLYYIILYYTYYVIAHLLLISYFKCYNIVNIFLLCHLKMTKTSSKYMSRISSEF